MQVKHTSERQVVVIGGGPAGLTAAYELTKREFPTIVVEKENKVGGLSRTEQYKGFFFDMGGHRFFTKVKEVNQIWHEVLSKDFLQRPRLSRIYYRQKFFYYPLKPLNALLGLGLLESLLIMLSYLRWHLFPYRQEETFEQWVTNRFGKRLFQTFFKTYTEKVWGISCAELKAEWAAQRIKDLSLKTALLNMFMRPQRTIKTLIEQFDYPRHGPGMMWNAMKTCVEAQGGEVRLETDVLRICRRDTRLEHIVVARNGREETIAGSEFISSMPLTEFLTKLTPVPPPEVLQAVARLNYRDFLTVCLIVNKADLFPDNWIYIHDPTVQVGRIQNFKNWSPEMVPDLAKTSLGLEYFCNEGDSLWSLPDAALIELGKREISRIGLAAYGDIEDGCVCRVPKAYPVYDADYREHLDLVRAFVESLENFQSVGRNGLHRYNNQDHAMLTGMLAVRNLALGEKNDLWNVNTDPEYHEEIREEVVTEGQDVSRVLQQALSLAFPKLDRLALGMALGTVVGLGLCFLTLALAWPGENALGAKLALLHHYFPGYRITVLGSMLGLMYGFVTGFLSGWGFAFLRNTCVFLSMAFLHHRAERQLLRKLFEYL